MIEITVERAQVRACQQICLPCPADVTQVRVLD
jgi:hypothetical protein